MSNLIMSSAANIENSASPFIICYKFFSFFFLKRVEGKIKISYEHCFHNLFSGCFNQESIIWFDTLQQKIRPFFFLKN